MGYTAPDKKTEDLDKHLKLENALTEDKKPVKIGEEVSGLLLGGKDVDVDGTLNAKGNLYVTGDTSVEKDLSVNGVQTIGNLNNYAQLEVSPTGDLEIQNVTDGATTPDITLNSDGNIYLNSDGNDIICQDGSVKFAALSNLFNNGALRLYSTADNNDYLTISSGVDGANTITAIATDAAATLQFSVEGNMTFDIGGAIVLDSGDGHFVAKKAGTEFSVANSAYAGMILGYRCLGHDAGRIAFDIPAISFGTLHANATVRFIAPPSGVVEVFVQAGMVDSPSGRSILFGLSDNATYNTLGAEHEEWVHTADESDVQVIQNTWVISGLTAGDTYNYWFGAKSSHSGSVINYGGTGTAHYSPFIMKVTALPAAVSDFAVYG